jgi:hypothetical protein
MVFTVCVMALETSVVAVTQVRLVVIVQVTILELARVLLVKDALFVPTTMPLTFHW